MKINTEDKMQSSGLQETEACSNANKEAEKNRKEAAEDIAVMADEKPIDYRYVRHGQGPCDCCGPHSE